MTTGEDTHRWGASLGGRTPSGEKADNETLAEFFVRRRKELEERFKIRELERDMARVDQPSALSPSTKEDTSLGKLMLEMINSERTAREAAEKSRTEADKARWEAEANRIQQMISDAEKIKLEAGQHREDPYEVYKRVKSIFDEAKADIAKNFPQGSASGLDGPTTITLEQMRTQHVERMEDLKYQRDITLQQMRETHDITMEETRLRRIELEAKLEEIRQARSSQQGAWTEIIELAGRAAMTAVAGETASEVAESSVRTPAGLAVYKCDGCKFPIPVPPEVEQEGGTIACPKCDQEYQVAPVEVESVSKSKKK